MKFREKIAGDLFIEAMAPMMSAIIAGHEVRTMVGGKSFLPDEIAEVCAERAQHLADACCQAWGHDWQSFLPSDIGAATLGVAQFGKFPEHEACARCGSKRVD